MYVFYQNKQYSSKGKECSAPRSVDSLPALCWRKTHHTVYISHLTWSGKTGGPASAEATTTELANTREGALFGKELLCECVCEEEASQWKGINTTEENWESELAGSDRWSVNKTSLRPRPTELLVHTWEVNS